MSEEDFKRRVEERWGRRENRFRKRGGGRFVGVAMLIIGGLFLAKASGVLFPTWFFTWPVLLIGIGLFSGIRHGFRGIGWLFPIAIGGIFLADNLSTDINLRPYLWPIILIAMGLFIIFRPKGRHCRRGGGPGDNAYLPENSSTTNTGFTQEDKAQWQQAMHDGNDAIDITAIFGGVKKNVLTKNFRGGDITAVMGGAELNLSQADFNGKAMIDCFNMFGGTKIIVPPDWEVQSDIVAIFGGVEDKRPPSANVNPTKVLFLDGTCIFGGVEIRSY